jgi:hypothetical protein
MSNKFKRKTNTFGFNFKDNEENWLDSYGEKTEKVYEFLRHFLCIMKRKGIRFTPKNYEVYKKAINHISDKKLELIKITPIRKTAERYFTKDVKNHGLNKLDVVIKVVDENIELLERDKLSYKIKTYYFLKIFKIKKTQ